MKIDTETAKYLAKKTAKNAARSAALSASMTLINSLFTTKVEHPNFFDALAGKEAEVKITPNW